MQWRESLQDEHWSSPIHLWHSLSYGSEKLSMGNPILLNLQPKIPSNMDEVKKKEYKHIFHSRSEVLRREENNFGVPS